MFLMKKKSTRFYNTLHKLRVYGHRRWRRSPRQVSAQCVAVCCGVPEVPLIASSKEPLIASSKEPHTSTNEPRTSAKETYTSVKEPCRACSSSSRAQAPFMAKEPHTSAQEPDRSARAPFGACLASSRAEVLFHPQRGTRAQGSLAGDAVYICMGYRLYMYGMPYIYVWDTVYICMGYRIYMYVRILVYTCALLRLILAAADFVCVFFYWRVVSSVLQCVTVCCSVDLCVSFSTDLGS